MAHYHQGPRHSGTTTINAVTATHHANNNTTSSNLNNNINNNNNHTSSNLNNNELQSAAQSNKEQANYRKLQQAFIRDLQHFHDAKGTPFRKIPKISGKEVDLYKLYTLVTSRGGWIQVNSKNEWVWLCEEFHLPKGCVNSGVGLKQIYLRYLDRYEKVHFLGEDGHPVDDDDEDNSSSRHRKVNVRSLHSVPLTYNHNQHNVAESLREYNGLSSNLYKPSNYDKLALSLLSPLPNEQDFAINVCTLLSNEGKHTLRLDKYPRLVNHLLAHAGVFDSPGTRQLFIEVYSRVRNYSINSFWSDVLESQDVLDLTDEKLFVNKPSKLPKIISRKNRGLNKENNVKAPVKSTRIQIEDVDCPMEVDTNDTDDIEILNASDPFRDQNQNSLKFEDDDKDLFCVGRSLGTQDPYGQRVLQIASILRNLSFTPENAAILGRNLCFLRFVLLCVKARWSNLHQLGFDTLGNVAHEIVLRDAGDRLRSIFLKSVCTGIESQDRFIVISCLEVLNKVSQQDLNEDFVTGNLESHVYETICKFLALSDIALLVYTLECLYALTSLGERPCTSVAWVRGAVDTLVALVTVEAQSYGPKACIHMRVVETVSTVPVSQQQQQQQQSQQDHEQHHSQSSPAHPTPINQQRLSSIHTSPLPHVSGPTLTMPSTPVPVMRTPSPARPQPLQQVQVQTQTPHHIKPQIQISTQTSSQSPVQVPIQPQNPMPTQMQIQVTPNLHIMKQVVGQSLPQPMQPPSPQMPTLTPSVPVQTSPVAPTQVVAQTPPVITGKISSTTSKAPSSKSAKAAAAAAVAAANTIQAQTAHQQHIQENEQFALSWLRATFELAPGVKIEQEELYKKYISSVAKVGRRGMIAPLHFPRCVRTVFGSTVGPNAVKGESPDTMYYEGIRVKANPGVIYAAPVSTGQSASSTNNTAIIGPNSVKVHAVQQHTVQATLNSSPANVSFNLSPTASNQVENPASTTQAGKPPFSPILQAQLSAPPRHNPLPNQNTNVFEFKSQVSVAHPHLSQALLASGNQPGSAGGQNQQVQMQVVVKEENRSAPTSSIIKSLLANKVTVSSDCMPSTAVNCVSAPTATACITNTTTSSINANEILTTNQVVQRQQKLLQQQLSGTIQQVPAPILTTGSGKNVVVTKPKLISAKKVQRINGAKMVMASNYEKTEILSNENIATQIVQTSQIGLGAPENHISAISGSAIQSLTSIAPIPNIQVNKTVQLSTPMAEDSDSTNNSVASSSGIGSSKDCIGIGVDEENSLMGFDGALVNGVPGNMGILAQDDSCSKDSSESKEKPLQGMMLADLLERKVEKEPLMNGILGKKDLVENHIKKALNESIDEVKIKTELVQDKENNHNTIQLGVKRSLSENDEIECKKMKFPNGTNSPDANTESNSTDMVTNIKNEELDDEKVTVSSTAANLYAALAADIIEDETDLEEIKEEIKEEVKPIKQEITEPEQQLATMNQITISQEQLIQQQQLQQQQQQQIVLAQQQIQQQLQQQGLIVAAPRQIVMQQAIQSSNQILIPGGVKNRPPQPQVLLQQAPNGQFQYVVSGGVPGQNYVLAQSQTALVQGQPQTVLVAQTSPQQGSTTKTIIILQPQTAQATSQKMVAVTPQGRQQVVVAQVPRPMIQNPVVSNLPAPLVSSSGPPIVNQTPVVPQGVLNNNPVQQNIAIQTNPNGQLIQINHTNSTQQVQIPQQNQIVQSPPVPVTSPNTMQPNQPVTNNPITRAITPTPSSTPPPRPATPHQIVATQTTVPKPTPKLIKPVHNTATNTTPDIEKPSTSQEAQPKTITIKIDPNAFLCEWRGCLKQFKTANAVFIHVTKTHCPAGNEEALCLWPSCDNLKRRRFSLMTHIYDKHTNPDAMMNRRKQLAAAGRTEISSTASPTPSSHHGYAPNAALHAIKRHAIEFVNPKELMQRPTKPAATITSSSSQRSGQNPPPEQDDNEGPVTKSIRLTAALILRNLVIYSSHGRRQLRAYERHLAGVALSNVESSRTIAQVLYDMNEQSSSGHR